MKDECALTRRGFIKGGLVIGSSVIFAGGAAMTTAVAGEPGDESLANIQYGFLVDLNKCSGCENCVAACRHFNHLSDETPDRRTVAEFTNGKGEAVYVSTSCMHCAEPSCLRVCPAGAISKGSGGIVSTNKDRCIGCKYCFQACPYGVPRYDSVAMDKCDCCLSAGVAPGETPHCVRECKFNALQYGPIEDLVAQAQGKAAQIGSPNDPSCWLIGEVN